jgi:hypothetical protein
MENAANLLCVIVLVKAPYNKSQGYVQQHAILDDDDDDAYLYYVMDLYNWGS